jgi:hypothetical protein
MGRDQAVLALAIVSTKSETHFTRSAGGYFAGMLRKHQRGELHLQRSLWALREAKRGKASRHHELSGGRHGEDPCPLVAAGRAPARISVL